MSTGMFIPNRVSNNFVPSQRTAKGAYKWDQAVGEVGLAQQAALQTLNKEYSNTINNAYSNFLLANRGIRGAQMGQGYKEAYIENTQQGLQQQIAEINMNAGNVRQQLGQQTLQALGDINTAYETEVSNLNRVAGSAGGYLNYLTSLMSMEDASKTYATADMELDKSYDFVFGAQPQSYIDPEGKKGMSYIEWVHSQIKDTQSDAAWYNWFNTGGLQQFRDAVKKGIKPL